MREVLILDILFLNGDEEIASASMKSYEYQDEDVEYHQEEEYEPHLLGQSSS